MKLLLRTFAFCLVSTLSLVSGFGAQTVQVILMAGQSNMVGYSPAGTLFDSYVAPSNVLYYDGSPASYNGTLTSLHVGPRGGTTDICFGPEMTFGSALAAAHPDTQYLFVKYAVGGTYLAQDPTHTASWDISYTDGLYQNFKNTVANALTAATNAGYTPQISGMLWLQGENDSYSLTAANAYAANLTALINDVRGLYGTDLPFVIGGIGSDINGFMTYRGTVMAAQADVANTLDNVAYFSNDDINTEKNLHFTGEDMLVIGERFAVAYESVPEPSTWSLLGLSVIFLIASHRRLARVKS